MGERYRQELLSHGGGRPPQELIEGIFFFHNFHILLEFLVFRVVIL